MGRLRVWPGCGGEIEKDGLKLEDGMPRLTSSNSSDLAEDEVAESDNQTKKDMIDLGDDSSSEGEDSDEDDNDFEIMAPAPPTNNAIPKPNTKKPSAMDLFF